MLDVLAAAIADRQRLPEHPLPIELADVTVRIDAETAEWARQEARASGLPHNEARAVFSEIVTYVLTERAIARIGRGWLTREDRQAWEQLRADLLDGARRPRQVHRRARRTLADPDAGNPAGTAVHVPRAAARGRRRPGAVARRRRRLDGVGRAAARRTGRPARPRQAGRPGRRAGTRRPRPSTPRACWTSWSAART